METFIKHAKPGLPVFYEDSLGDVYPEEPAAVSEGNGEVVDDDEVLSIESHRSRAKKQVDLMAGQCRAQYITCVEGQDLVYGMKEDEATAYLANNSIDLDTVPHIKERSERLGVTPLAVATEWQVKADTWISISPVIEGIREGANDSIKAAIDKAEMDVIVESLSWPVSALAG
ncbi:MAG: hypothetical protein HOE62_11345 [Alphaproteobacteria bacterium]|jgi:hypothetical protein|nr:hypothetical protein [Alphaproteobacteria bacterium]